MENSQNTYSVQDSSHNSGHSSKMYFRFVMMAIAMFVVMYVIMYAMIDSLQNFIPNINNLYMTLMMTSAMLLLELWIMRAMYPNPKMNTVIVMISIIIGFFSWFGIREQIGVDDCQFVKGMIPHHAAAILMSEKTRLTDPELIKLQKNILETQQKEIELMKWKLKEFEERK